MKIRTAVIPAAGNGTRWSPVSRVVPKELLPIGNVPAIEIVVREAFAAGIEDVVIVNSPRKGLIAEYFAQEPRVRFVWQQEARGLGDAVLRAEAAVGGRDFMVLLPDVILGAYPANNLFNRPNRVGVFRVREDQVSNYGMVTTDSDMRVLSAVEKPLTSESRLAIVGRYSFTQQIFDCLRQCQGDGVGELGLTPAINLLAETVDVLACDVAFDVFDVGTPAGMARAWSNYYGRKSFHAGIRRPASGRESGLERER